MTEREIFAQALEIEATAERAAFLDRACGGDAALRERVNGLLAERENLGSYLEVPAAAVVVATVDPPARTRPGLRIGRYRLLEQIGEGGMGTVWVAEQTEPVKRRVALKLIKPGMDSRQVLSRFDAERQALALMDHPNIAKVFDGGMTDEGRPFFVMEYVKGMPITEYCDHVRLSIADRLKLFVPVCQAVQHAHHKGIIHRDLKPSNILICLYDGQPVPKVIDFGLAKAISQPLTEHTLYTAHGLMVGTPLYMSPEQAEFNNLDIDTRTDIYSLGVILYELLTGTTPLGRQQFKDAAFQEILRLIKEVEPPKPSAKLSTSDNLPSIAAQRSLEPAQLSRVVRGDLDWIVMKSLEKERSRRYETANGLARDIDRYLHDEPVEAGPPSAGYRLLKLVRRHRGPVLAAALVLLALLAGVVGTTWGLIRAEQARQAEAEQRALSQANEQKALEQKRIAEAVQNFLQRDLLRQADALEQFKAVQQAGGGFETTENPTIKELLDRAAAELMPGKIDAKFPQQMEVQASILHTVGATYLSIGEYGKAVEFLMRSSDTYRHAVGADHTDTLTALDSLAGATLSAGKIAEGVALFEHVRDARVKWLGADHPDTLNTLNNLGQAYLSAGKTAEAVALYEQVRDARVKQLGAEHVDTLVTLHYLAVAYQADGKTAEAVALFDKVHDTQVEKLGADHPHTLMTLERLGVAYLSAGKTAEAVSLFEKLRDVWVKKLGTDHPQTLATQLCLAGAYFSAGKTAEAISLYEQVRDACVKKLGADHPFTLGSLDNLAGAYLSAGKTAEAVALYEQVRNARVKKLGADHPHTLYSLHYLAEAYWAAGKTAEAIGLFEQARDAQMKKLGANHPETLSTLAGLALAYQAAGKLEQALPLLQQAAVGIEKRHFVHPHAGRIVVALIACHRELNQYDQVEAWRRKWLAVVKERSGADSLLYATEMALLGLNLLKQKKWTDAEAALHDCLAIREKKQPDDWTTFSAQSMLGEALLGQKKYADAEPLLLSGHAGLKQREAVIPPQGKVRLADALERLIDLYTAWDKPDEAAKWQKALAEHPAASIEKSIEQP